MVKIFLCFGINIALLSIASRHSIALYEKIEENKTFNEYIIKRDYHFSVWVQNRVQKPTGLFCGPF